jgi:hypothetical protein
MTAVLWSGVLLCVWVVRQYWAEARAVINGIGAVGGGCILLAFAVIWWTAAESWRRVLIAAGGDRIPLTVAARHLALLLLGKYIPGGVWGFAARLADSRSYGSLASATAAGLVEQWIGLSTMTLLGAIALAVAYTGRSSVLLLMCAVPFVVVLTLRIAATPMAFCVRRVPVDWQKAAGSAIKVGLQKSIWAAAAFTMVQVMVTLAVVSGVGVAAFNFDAWTMLAIAGCYGIGIAAGIAAVFAPGGILVREAAFLALCDGWVPPAEAIAMAGALRLIFTCFDLAAGSCGALMQKMVQQDER